MRQGAVARDAEPATVEDLASKEALHPLQQAFREHHALQVRVLHAGLSDEPPRLLGKETPRPSDEEIRVAISGNLCRCTGYEHIVRAAKAAAEKLAAEPAAGSR